MRDKIRTSNWIGMKCTCSIMRVMWCIWLHDAFHTSLVWCMHISKMSCHPYHRQRLKELPLSTPTQKQTYQHAGALGLNLKTT